MAVGGGAPGPYVTKVISKLMERLRQSTDWLVRARPPQPYSGPLPDRPPPPQSALKTLMVFHRLMRETGGFNFVRLLASHCGVSPLGDSYGGASKAGAANGVPSAYPAGATGFGNSGGGGSGGGGGAAYGASGGPAYGGGGGAAGSSGSAFQGASRGLNMDNFIDKTNTTNRCGTASAPPPSARTCRVPHPAPLAARARVAPLCEGRPPGVLLRRIAAAELHELPACPALCAAPVPNPCLYT